MSNQRIFIILDDDLDAQELFIEAVNEVDKSIRCVPYSDCEEALELMKSKKMDLPDIIFLDLNMPRINGKQCLVELKKHADLRHIPIVIYTTSSEKRDIEETTRLGASYFLTKPNKFEELCHAIKYLASRDWNSNN